MRATATGRMGKGMTKKTKGSYQLLKRLAKSARWRKNIADEDKRTTELGRAGKECEKGRGEGFLRRQRQGFEEKVPAKSGP